MCLVTAGQALRHAPFAPSATKTTKALFFSPGTALLDYKGMGWCPTLRTLHLLTMKAATALGIAMSPLAEKEDAMFDFFNPGSRAYARRVETMLREARFAQLEHAAAAEHHSALAHMYADRVLRLESACRDAVRRDKLSASPEETGSADELLQRADRAPLRVLSPAAGTQASG